MKDATALVTCKVDPSQNNVVVWGNASQSGEKRFRDSRLFGHQQRPRRVMRLSPLIVSTFKTTDTANDKSNV